MKRAAVVVGLVLLGAVAGVSARQWKPYAPWSWWSDLEIVEQPLPCGSPQNTHTASLAFAPALGSEARAYGGFVYYICRDGRQYVRQYTFFDQAMADHINLGRPLPAPQMPVGPLVCQPGFRPNPSGTACVR